MFKKIIIILAALGLCAAQIGFARGRNQSVVQAQEDCRKAAALAQQKASQDAEQARQQNAQGARRQLEPKKENQGQGAGPAAQGEVTREQQLEHLQSTLIKALQEGKIDPQGVIAQLSSLQQAGQLTGQEAQKIAQGIEQALAPKPGMLSSIFAMAKGLGRKIVANPARSILFTVGTIATILHLYKNGPWSILKEWGIESWNMLKQFVHYDGSNAGKVIREGGLVTVEKAIPTGKALRNLCMGRWTKTLPHRAWKSIKTFTQEAIKIIKQRGIPEVKKSVDAIIAPSKKQLAWDIFKKQGGELIDILSPLEHPVSRALSGVGL